MKDGLSLSAQQRQKQALSGKQLQALGLLAKSLPELRAEIAAEMSANPAIEDFDHSIETPLSEVQAASEMDSDEPDFPESGYESTIGKDEAAAERRQAFFDNQVKDETLQEHLLAQLPLSDIVPCDYPIVEVLIGDLDSKGYYKGSVADVAMAFGRTEDEIISLLAKIRDFDPPGCGARDVAECLLSQLNSIEDESLREIVQKIITDHLDDILSGRIRDMERALGVSGDRLRAAVLALRSLDGRPGRQYSSERERVEFVNPEIHAELVEGKWIAQVDERSLPEIKISEKFKALLEDASVSAETKEYVKERIAAAVAFRDAIAKRRDTVKKIAQEIFDRQQGFFEKGFSALAPLTEGEVAAAVGVHSTTVSRTVRDKYAQTPFGTVELRRFFVTGIKTADGAEVSQDAVMRKLAEIIDDEDPSQPLSDEKLSSMLAASGFAVARRTVAKYRDKLGILGVSARRVK